MVYPLLEEIKMRYKQGERERLIWKLRDLGFIPKDLYPIAADIIAQTILNARSSWRECALYEARTRLKISIESPEGEQILSAILQKALDPATEYRGDLIRYLDTFDDPRVLKTLVRIYKFEAAGLKSDIVLALKSMGKEEALPVLLDHCFSQMRNYTKDQSKLLVKYPIVDDADGLRTEISAEDRDQFINILLAYLKETEPFADNMFEYLGLGNGPNITIAYVLDLLYNSPKTLPVSKAKILANKNCWVDCYVVDYQHDAIGHNELGYYLTTVRESDFCEEIKKLYQQGEYKHIIYLLKAVDRLPQDLYPIVTDAILQAGKELFVYFIDGLEMIIERNLVPLETVEVQRLLDIFPEIAPGVDPYSYPSGQMWPLVGIDDPRVFRTLVNVYKKTDNQQKKRDALYLLGKVGGEASLPILLDNFVQQSKILSDDQLGILRNYCLEDGFDDQYLDMNPADRNTVINILLNYLTEQKAYDDPLRIDVAHILAILYTSPKTLYVSKETIKAMSRQNIFAIPQDSIHPASYISLSDFIEFTDGKSI